MDVTPQQIQALVEAELQGLRDGRVATHIRSLLVLPSAQEREWDYGTPGQTYPCWAVLDHAKSNSGIAYCQFGFGPEMPWGLVSLSGAHMSMGMDCQWFDSFLDAYFESRAATELPIWRIFKQVDKHYPGAALTSEADWDSTWTEIRRLRAADPVSRYHCLQSIHGRADET
jgi:hypothetical protein